MIQDKQDSIAVIVAALFCIVLYFNSLGGLFVFDDFHGISDNLYIKDVRYIPLFFKGYYTSDTGISKGMFRPLLMLSFVFNYAASRLQPLGYHLLNITLHFLNVIMLYCFLKRLKKDLPFGLLLLVSLLFLVHPLNTEAVTYISSRSDLLACFFVLTAVLCYIRSKFIFTLILYILGLLSKETTLVLPFLIFGYDYLSRYITNDQDLKPVAKNKYIFYISILVVSAIYWLYRQHLYGPALAVLSNSYKTLRDPYSNILTQLAVSIFYLRLFIWPQPLVTHHNFPILKSLLHPMAFFSALAIILVIAGIFTLRKKHSLLSIGLFWYLVCLLPKFYAPLNIVAAEHHFYLPSFGIYLILAVLLNAIYLRFRRKFITIFLGIICIFSVLTWFRNYEYTNMFVFWRKAIQEDPSSPIAHHNLGIVYLYKGLYEDAERELKKALSLSPPSTKRIHAISWDNLANIYRLQKRYKEAIAELNKVINSEFATFGTYQNLGATYLDMGEEKKALEMWQKGLSLNPQSSGIFLNMGLHYLRKLEFGKAKECFKQAIKYDPDSSLAYFGLGRVLQQEGKTDDAIKAFEESALINPNYADAHYYLGDLYAKKSDGRAINEFREAIRIFPKFAEAHNNLAVLYTSMQPPQLDLARQHAQKAIDFGYKVDKDFLKLINFSQEKTTPADK